VVLNFSGVCGHFSLLLYVVSISIWSILEFLLLHRAGGFTRLRAKLEDEDAHVKFPMW
jgi:hypothetical protein